MGRELPKAYLRLDPDVDQKHPDNLAEFIRLMCASNRQRPRGRFVNREVLEALFGRSAVGKFYVRGDVAERDDGSVYTVGWDEWQEGDMTVAERVQRTRRKKADALHGRNTGATPSFPDPLRLPLPPSLSIDSLNDRDSEEDIKTEDAARFSGPGDQLVSLLARWGVRGLPLNTKLTGDLDALVEDYGEASVLEKFKWIRKDRLNREASQFVWGAKNALRVIPTPPKADPELAVQHAKEDAEAEARRTRRNAR